MDWHSDVAESVLEVLQDANYHKLPLTVEEWTAIACLVGCELTIYTGDDPNPGMYIDDVAMAKWSVHDETLIRRIAHELAEHVLVRPCAEPYLTDGSNDSGNRHKVARLVETLVLCQRSYQRR